MEDFIQLLSTLGLTIIIEYPIVQVLWLLLKADKSDIKSKLVFWKNRIIIIPALIVNILTNPAINIFARYLFRNTNLENDTIWFVITILEFIIWALEGVMYKYLLKTKWSTAMTISTTANFMSYMSSFIL